MDFRKERLTTEEDKKIKDAKKHPLQIFPSIY
jgi:hypothetical protein